MEASFRISILWNFPSEKAFIFGSNLGWKEGLEWPCQFFCHPVHKRLLAGCTPSPWAQECGFGRGTEHDFQRWPAPLQTAPHCPAAAASGRRADRFSFGLSSSWPPNWKYLGCQEQQTYLLFPHKSWDWGCWICFMMECLSWVLSIR